jgi:hypothetical protein
MSDHYFTRDFNNNDLASDPTPQQVRPGSGQPRAQFFTMERRNEALSASRGRYVPMSVDMVRIIIPGDKHNIVERRIREDDKTRYQKQYEAFKKMEEFVPDGTLIETWPMISRTQVYELKAAGIFTVEDIVAIPDSNLGILGLGGRLLRKYAQSFIETSKTNAVPAQLVAAEERARIENESLKRQVKELSDRLELLTKQSGKSVSDAASPMAEALAELPQPVAAVSDKVHVPAGYEKLTFLELKKIAASVSSAPVMSKADAVEVIAEYLKG